MPILDHFHPPLYPKHSWESFHMRWAAAIADALDQRLPQELFAEVHTHLGTQVSCDDLEVRILGKRGDSRVTGVVKLVTPQNKDRPDARSSFAAKCAAYLQRGVGVVVADIVTSRQANLHNELIDVLRLDQTCRQGGEVTLTALAYRPAHRDAEDQIDVWAMPLSVGGTLPVMPLALRGADTIPLDLEATYTDTRKRCRL